MRPANDLGDIDGGNAALGARSAASVGLPSPSPRGDGDDERITVPSPDLGPRGPCTRA